MKKIKGMPITGNANLGKSTKKPYVPDAKETSLDAQNFIKQDASPFKDRNTAAQLPTGVGMSNGMKPALGGQRAPSLPSGAAVGQRKMPNQSGQVFGRMGTSHPKRKGAFPSGFSAKRGAAFYGE